MKNLKNKFFSILMVLSIMLSAFVVIDNNVAEAADQCIINTASKSLYLRAQAVNGRVLANMPRGATVTRHRVENGWAYVSYNGTYGWCLDSYLRFVRNLDNNNTVQPVSRYANIREGWYRLAPENAPSFAMDVASSGGSGTNVFQYQNYNTNNQKFYIKSVGGGFYSLKAGHADVYLDVWSADGRNGANIQVFAGNNSDAQKFAFMSAGNGAYYIVPKVNTNLVVEVSGGGTDNCKNVQLWTRADVSHHKWKLISTSAPGTITTINNTFQQYTKTAQRQTKAYATSSLDSVYGNEWVDKGDVVTVLEETSNAYKVRYPVRNGYKERWVNKNIFTVEPVYSNTNTNINWDSKVGQQLANTNGENYKSGINPFKKSYYDDNGKYHETNCTWYAWGRMREVTGKSITFNGGRNAGQWAYNTTNCSKVALQDHCIAVNPNAAKGYGHVVFVEHVNSNTVYYTEANVNRNTDLKVKTLTVSEFKNKYTTFLK